MPELEGLLVQLPEKHPPDSISTVERVALMPDLLVPGGLESPPNILDFQGVRLIPSPPHPTRKVEDDTGPLSKTSGSMANPLPSDENRESNKKLELDHLEWRRVPMSHQVANQAPIVSN
jgi:hypothetical protein